ncbi:MAG TPA: L-serine ammonia-lyase [Candidatus Hydrothermia bacterium]|nr:L-serine ammonia-lyase [Candidatus Hydrothermia bacterium]HOK23529.1 L-serine ammonia-lyase [Candidatus Hydrothermia bacterium]HOL24242.1 L-serine ammonia-lyase [Candidatus Hydrothermia bacterium]HPO79187.1 L-serine ammonia-lyase [Candidatus Hydrothermia bacterium]
MESIKILYKIGHGPSSSHTMGPSDALRRFMKAHPGIRKLKVTLYGSLAATGKGHLTEDALKAVFDGEIEISEKPDEFLSLHPNAFEFKGFNEAGDLLGEEVYYSIGGGTVKTEKEFFLKDGTYPLNSMEKVLDWCEQTGKSLWEFVEEYEGEEIWDFLQDIWSVMDESVKRGLRKEGVLPGELHIQRKAWSYYIKAINSRNIIGYKGKVFAYALAVSEENADGGLIVTAPTCGSCGIVPSVLYFLREDYGLAEEKILRGLATAGLVGALVRENASISGAEVGCQGEVGVACAMAAAAATQILGGTVYQIEYAAEMGIEHHLGLTCDPVLGYVQIPCIERNAVAAIRALECATYALLSDGRHMISFDVAVHTMKETGRDLPSAYKETARGGLALHWRDKKKEVDENSI